MEPRFLADSNVGRLARWLRAMGYDTLFMPQGDDVALVRLALQQGRILLTRDSVLLHRKLVTTGTLRALLVRDDDYVLQLRQVAAVFGLSAKGEFSRCVECNEPLQDATPQQVEGRVPPFVFQTHREFKECPACRKLYWRGTHWSHMREEIARALPRNGEAEAQDDS